MRRFYLSTGLILVGMLATVMAMAQSWPLQLTLNNGYRVKVYEPQPGLLSGSQLEFRSAISLWKNGSEDPVFGTLWANCSTRNDGQELVLSSLSVTGIRFPSEIDETTTQMVESGLESLFPSLRPRLNSRDVQAALERNRQVENLDRNFQNKAPKVIYATTPSMLVIIDGNPVWKRNDEWGLDVVVNSPSTLVKNPDGRYYLYGANHWYQANSLNGPYQYSAYPPAQLRKVEASIQEAEKNSQATGDGKEFDNGFNYENREPVSNIIVSTVPAELIQSKGEADFRPVSNTSLLYVSNSPNDIFMEVNSQLYYVLLSGRWYRASSLKGNWEYIQADQLPEDFANIPAGSPKDNVLASVAGTPAASSALMDAQLPQTARVERNRASAAVDYDGEPEFERITGTRMAYAVNASATVLRYRSSYFLVDNGVWFRSGSPYGPWRVSDTRPDEVDLIPPSYPVYNVKYVYIYDVTPDFIYMGYTPGYMNTYIFGPTVVYGTGYYYRPWYRRHYFPRPFTWGFNMHYSPWFGWSIGFNYYPGWFHAGYRYRPWNYWYGGWWGPTVYRPAYCGPRFRDYGYYGYRNNRFYVDNRSYHYTQYNRYYNVYNQRPAINTRDNRRYYGTVPNNRAEYQRPAISSRPSQPPVSRENPARVYNNRNNERNDFGQRQRSIREEPRDPRDQREAREPRERMENRGNDRPVRTYRPQAEPGGSAGRQPEIQPQLRNRMENRERPAISRENNPGQQRQYRQPSQSPSRQQGRQGEVRRPERRGN